ncbi:MAG: pyruvate kinase [Gammaproteobacteria bacterium]|nr:pyruvate kinase [Gammaproteobacteria bacterium]
MKRRTKIVTTLGPGTDNPEVLEQLILAGANVVRLNFSHGEADDHKFRANLVREIAAKHNKWVAVLGDLQGPKIRIARFKNDKIELEDDDDFVLDASLGDKDGDQGHVGIDYKDLPEDVVEGDLLLLDDGRVQMTVDTVEGPRIHCKVTLGGPLSNNKGINRKGGGLSAPALTDKDREDIKIAADIDVDYLAVSFPRSAADIYEATKLMREAGSKASVVAKIERSEVVMDHQLLDEVILASDVVMVARGDLGVEIGDAELIGVQKHIIKRARTLNRIVITATQMMESMITAPVPTRAEVFDVANAVLDGTDAVMLSAETATGEYPIQVVEAMSRVCMGAEHQKIALVSSHRVECEFKTTNEAIAMATMYTANHLQGVKAILCLTESGATPLWMSRISSGMPIYALTRHERTRRKIALYRGVEALPFDVTSVKSKDVNRCAVDELISQGILKKGEIVILTKGEHMGVDGETNAMKILVAGHVS